MRECEKGLPVPNLKHLKGVRRGACSEHLGGEKGEPILNLESAYLGGWLPFLNRQKGERRGCIIF